MPNQENIRKWVEALRSGKYVQARNTLKENQSYCCLAVANDISGEGYWAHNSSDEKERADEDGSLYVVRPEIRCDLFSEDDIEDEGEWTEEFLAPSVAKWLGFGLEDNPQVTCLTSDGKKEIATLSSLNDDYALSFNEIADIIEANFLKERT